MSVNRFCRVFIVLTFAIAGLAGCGDNSVTPPDDDPPATKSSCIDCHGSEDALKNLLPGKGDGISPEIADDG